MLPHIRRRPVTMERYHRGIGAPGFFQKDVSKGFPAWLKRVEVPKNDGIVNHPIVTDTQSLLWLANQNSITIHVWLPVRRTFTSRTSAFLILIHLTTIDRTFYLKRRWTCARCSGSLAFRVG